MLRNKEFRTIMIKLLILQLLFALVGFFTINMFMDKVNDKIIVESMKTED